jgi:hypothetical protein
VAVPTDVHALEICEPICKAKRAWIGHETTVRTELSHICAIRKPDHPEKHTDVAITCAALGIRYALVHELVVTLHEPLLPMVAVICLLLVIRAWWSAVANTVGDERIIWAFFQIAVGV